MTIWDFKRIYLYNLKRNKHQWLCKCSPKVWYVSEQPVILCKWCGSHDIEKFKMTKFTAFLIALRFTILENTI